MTTQTTAPEDVREPQTELEFWLIIEDLGGVRWSINHDLADNRPVPSGAESASRAERDMYERQKQLVTQLDPKFGIIFSHEVPYQQQMDGSVAPPAGKRWYWPWYKKMKEQAKRIERQLIICAGCPFSGDREQYRNSYNLSCALAPHSWVSGSPIPHRCMRVVFKDMSQADLLDRIRQDFGRGAVRRFRKMRHALLPNRIQGYAQRIISEESMP